ncbi:MAG: hypothetical protein AAFP16_08730 [Pseudomonadota bacterium]
MISALLHRGTCNFEQQFNYDARYQHEIIDIDPRAGARLAGFQMLSNYRGPASARDIVLGAFIGSTVEGDCGPCAQLTVDMALAAGADPDALRACLAGQDAGDLTLGYRFAQAAIAGAPSLDELRGRIHAAHGPRAVVAATFAAAFGRTYPVLKRGMGHGQTCKRLQVGDVAVDVAAA